jgi:alpha-glucoside transport system substrate-binding protein
MTHRARFLIPLVLIGVLPLLPACGTASADAGTVTMLGSETAAGEAATQNRVLAEFTRETGIRVVFQHGTRALDQEIQSGLQTGTQPDIAILPSPGELQTFAGLGVLQPLDHALGDQGAQYGPQWASLAGAIQQPHAGKHVYAVPVKIALKSDIWYDPAALHRLLGTSWDGALPTDWQQLMDLANRIAAAGGTPWCMGMESIPLSGWPGTDWIEDILLHQAGPDAYARWADGTLPWQGAGPVEQAFATWRTIVGNSRNINGNAQMTNFDDASKPLFTSPPGCYLDHTAFIDNSAGKLRPGVDFDFFPFPTVTGQNGVEVSADFVAMFRTTPQAERLIHFLASDVGQQLWSSVPGVFSADRNVPESVYPDVVSKRVAQLLGHAGTLCFDASDLMPSAMSDAFNQAILAYLNDMDPAALNRLLGELDEVRAQAYHGNLLNYRCGSS